MNLGLRWTDIDFDKQTADLIWSVTSVDHKIVVKPYGKTGSTHSIMLDSGTIALLKRWRTEQLRHRLHVGVGHQCPSPDPQCDEQGYHDRDLVFARPDGNYLQPDQFSREFRRAQDKYNRLHPTIELPKVKLHSLRHGWATAALEAGISMKVIQDRLDHASEAITSDIYTHVRAPLQSDAAEKVAELLLPDDTARGGFPPDSLPTSFGPRG